MDESAYVSNIQRFCVHDGPGIRTVVFLVGCPLRCKWCQNPEAISRTPQLMYNPGVCTQCGTCADNCPEGAIGPVDGTGVVTDRERCKRCFLCTELCPFQARRISARSYTVDALYRELLKDAVFFKNTSGGITLSGGEPMLFPEFCYALLRKINQQGIHTAIETCGFARWESFERLLPVVDLFLYDIKIIDSQEHREWTGQDNRLIHANLAALVDRGKDVVVRVPLIPDVNDGGQFNQIVDFVAGFETLRTIHIMPFHQLGSSKYGLLGQDYDMASVREDNQERLAACKAYAESRGLQVSVGGSGFKQ